MEDLIIEKGRSLRKEEWEEEILKLKEEVQKKKPLSNPAEKISGVLKRTVGKNVGEEEEVAVMFSGGVDSTLIALILNEKGINFTCYTVGFKEEKTKMPGDVVWAERVAEKLGFSQETVMMGFEKAEKLAERTVSELGYQGGRQDIVNIGVGMVETAVFELLKESSIDKVFSGLGSEEIFAGYRRHDNAEDLQAECWDGLRKLYVKDLAREIPLLTRYDLTPSLPFLAGEVISTAMRSPPEKKMSDERKKVVLREAAVLLGLEEEFAWRKKRAAQYGSRTDSAISKLAKRAGYKYKKEYLNSIKDSIN